MFSIFHVKFVAKQICEMEDKRMDKTDDFQLGQMYKIEPEEPEVKEDITIGLMKRTSEIILCFASSI